MSSLVDDTKIRCSCSARELRSGSAGVSLRKECAVPVVVSELNVQAGSGVELQGTAKRTFFGSDHPAS
jgi:hypothetical protein